MTAAHRLMVFCGLLSVLSGCEGIQSVLDPAGTDARLIARLAWWMFASAVFILIVTLGLLLVGISLNRGKGRRMSFRTSTIIVVCGGVIAPVIAIVAVGLSGVMIADETEGDSGPVALTVEVWGERWWWEFRYLDEAGEVIAVTANELHLPVGERARLQLRSDNVIHSFWVPNLQGKTDLIPGTTNTMYAEPEVAGVWRAQCAEFCGIQHGLMAALVIAEPREEFDVWLATQAEPAAVADDHAGFAVFMEAGCGRCHSIRGTAADGDLGPDLTHLASRETLAAATIPNTEGNLGGWITSTHEIKRGALMPAFAPPADALHALTEYLGMLR